MWSGRAAAVILTAAVGLSVASCGSGRASVTAPALWYGTRSDGAAVSGVTPVTVTAVQADPSAAFTIDLTGLDGETDAAWRATAWSAGTQAMLSSGLDPRGHRLRIDVRESIGGPSAGAMLTAASAAALQDASLRPAVAATGTVLPDGGIGEVSGIPDKLRGAHDAGIAEVLIPAGQTEGVDLASGNTVDLEQYGQSLGISVVPMDSVQSVLDRVGEDVPPRAEAPPGPLAPRLAELTNAATQSSLARMSAPGFMVAPAPRGLSADRVDALSAAVADARSRVPELLAVGKTMEAWVLATTTERSVTAWNGGAAAGADVVGQGVAAATARVAMRAAEVERSASLERSRAAGTNAPTAESFGSLADALGWATDAIATARVTAQALASQPQSEESLAGHAADLAQVAFDTEVNLPLAVAAATQAPGTPPPDLPAALSRLDAYADLLAESAAANTAFFDATRASLAADADLPDSRLTADLSSQWRARPLESAQEAVLVRTSVALSHYVSSTVLVAGAAGFAAETGTPDPTRRIVVADGGAFERQVGTATVAADRQSRLLAGQGRSAAYLQWSRDWGVLQAQAPSEGAISDQTRREGLVYLWYATTSGRMLPTSEH